MKFNMRGKYFRRLLLSAFILVLIPVIVFIFLLTANQNRQLRAQAIDDYEKRIIQSVSSLDQRLLHVTGLPALLAANKDIDNLYGTPFDPINSVDIVSLLNHHCQFNSFVSDIYVHLPEHGMVYSSTMRMPDTSNPIGIRLDGCNYRDVRQSIDTMYTFTRNLVTLPHSRPTPIPRILYSAPVHTRGGSAAMSITIVLDDDTFFHYLSDRLELGVTAPYVCLLHDGDLIYSNASDENSALLMAAEDSLRMNGADCRIFIRESALDSYRYIFAMPEKALFANISPFPGVLLAIVALYMIFVICALWIFLRANYTPIHNIYAAVHKYISKSSTDELEGIRDTLELLETHVEELNTQVTVNHKAQKRTFLLDLMNGEWIGAHEELLARAEALNIPTSGSFAAMLITCADLDAFAGLLAPIQLYSAGNVENGYACCLCVCPASSEEGRSFSNETLRAALMSASDTMRIQFYDAPGVCVGNLFEHLSMAPFSYLEAKAAAELQHITGESILLYSDVALLMPDRSSRRKPALSFVELARSITQQDSAGVDAFMDSVVRFFHSFDMPMVDMRRILFDIYNAIFSVAPEISRRLTPIRTIFDLHTRDEIVDLLQSIRMVLSETENAQTRQSRLDMDAIDEYIMAHYADHDFSIRTLAAQANLSLPYFSQLFKKEKGVSPMDYVTDIRIRCAQKLLTETDLSIAEIVDQTGYYSISSFIKRFRQHTGMTPGEFRSK